MTRIALCMIVRDSADTLARCLSSVAGQVHEVNVLDTGSEDGTIELVEREGSALAGGAAVRLEQAPWRCDFGAAREESFTLASPAADWLLWLDADDELAVEGCLSELVDSAPPGTTALALYYECAHDTLGRVVEGVWRVRLVRRGAGYRWEGPVHEALRHPSGEAGLVHPVDPVRARVVHRPRPGRSDSDRNLAILLQAQAEAERRAEPLRRELQLSLGLELAGRARFAEAAEALAVYVADDRDGWSDARAHAAAECAACFRALGRVPEAIRLESAAASARPDWLELPLGLSESHGLAGRWHEAVVHAERSCSMPPPVTAVRLDPRWLRLGPLLRLVEAQLALGENERAAAGLAELRARAGEDGALRAGIEAAIVASDPATALMRARELAGRYDPRTRAMAQGLRLDDAARETS